jgi:hypothetical protein
MQSLVLTNSYCAIVPTRAYLPGPIPTSVLVHLPSDITIHFCGGLRLYRGLGPDNFDVLAALGGSNAPNDPSLCSICYCLSQTQSWLSGTQEPIQPHEASNNKVGPSASRVNESTEADNMNVSNVLLLVYHNCLDTLKG